MFVCRSCQKILMQEHYKKNKEVYIKRARKKAIFNRQWYVDYKEQNSCYDCGQRYPHYVTDFDHRDPATKKGNVSTMVTGSLKLLKEEIDKCDLVCANCHRIRTHGD
jgi:hypothetical protein